MVKNIVVKTLIYSNVKIIYILSCLMFYNFNYAQVSFCKFCKIKLVKKDDGVFMTACVHVNDDNESINCGSAGKDF